MLPSIDSKYLIYIYTALDRQQCMSLEQAQKYMDEMKNRIHELDSSSLVILVQILAAQDPEALDDKIEQRLIDDIPNLDPQSVSSACNAIHSSGINYENFLLKALTMIKTN